MLRKGADTGLDKATGVARLHDPSKWRSVRTRIAREIIIKIGMRIEMKDRNGAVVRVDRGKYRNAYSMITAQQYRDCTLFKAGSNRILNETIIACCVLSQVEVA